MASQVALVVKKKKKKERKKEKTPASAGDIKRFLGQGDPLEVNMATHSSILAWRIPWTEEPGGQ